MIEAELRERIEKARSIVFGSDDWTLVWREVSAYAADEKRREAERVRKACIEEVLDAGDWADGIEAIRVLVLEEPK